MKHFCTIYGEINVLDVFWVSLIKCDWTDVKFCWPMQHNPANDLLLNIVFLSCRHGMQEKKCGLQAAKFHAKLPLQTNEAAFAMLFFFSFFHNLKNSSEQMSNLPSRKKIEHEAEIYPKTRSPLSFSKKFQWMNMMRTRKFPNLKLNMQICNMLRIDD